MRTSYKKIFLCSLVMLMSATRIAFSADPPTPEPIATEARDKGTLRLIFAGDLMGHMPQHQAALQKDGTYNYEPCYKWIKDYIQSADLAIVNLEVTLAGKPYTGFPCFSAPDALARMARDAGFDIMTTANNHCVDKGRNGLERTLRVLDSMGVMHLGTYKDMSHHDMEHPLIVEKNGIRLALLSYTYGTNGLPVVSPNVVNLIDTNMMLRDLNVARERGADFVIAIVHWGVEYKTKASAAQESTAQWLLNHGCDAIIGGHPHVVQNLTTDALPGNGKYPEIVVYSMGNFISNMHDENCDGGIMIELELNKKDGKTSVHNCAYMPYWVHQTVEEGQKQYVVVPSTDAVAHPERYGISAASLKTLKRFDANTRARMKKGQAAGYDGEGLIRERHFYNDGQPSRAKRYTYFYLNYDNEFPGCPDTEPIYVYSFANELAVDRTTHVEPRWLSAFEYVDMHDYSLSGLCDDLTSLRPVPASNPVQGGEQIQWKLLDVNGDEEVYGDVVDGEIVKVVVRKGDDEVTPVPRLLGLPGVVKEVWVGGRQAIRLWKEEEISPWSAIPLQHRLSRK